MADRKQYGSSYIPDCPLCQGTNGGHYQTCPSYGGEKADERGSAPQFTKAPCKRCGQMTIMQVCSACADERGSAEPREPGVREALILAREYVEGAAGRMYDGTNGHGIRTEAKRRLAVIDAALATTPDSAQARDAAQAVELTEGELAKVYLTLDGGERGYPMLWSIKHLSRAIERAVLAKNGLGGKQ